MLKLSEDLLLQMIPHAKSAAKRAEFKHGVDPDDTFQQIMLEMWVDLLSAPNMENPVKYLRHRIKYAVGHVIQERFFRKGNGETDQFESGFEPSSPQRDLDLMIDIGETLNRQPEQTRQALILRYVVGLTQNETAEAMGVKPATVTYHLDKALPAFGVQPRTRRRSSKDRTVHFLKNRDGKEFRGTYQGIAELLGTRGRASDLLNGKLEHYKGWSKVA